MADQDFDTLLLARKLRPHQRTAQRILAQARRPMTDLLAVMASPPTRTQGALNQASSFGQGANAATYRPDGSLTANAAAPKVFDMVSHQIIFASNAWRVSGKTQVPPNRVGVFAYGFRFLTDAAAFDLEMSRNSAIQYQVYVTDIATGVRARVQANDVVTTANDSGWQYDKWDFGSKAIRLIEVYLRGNGQCRGMNVESGASVWKPAADEPRIGFVGDSWMDGTTSPANTSNPLKNQYPDWLAHYLGCNNLVRLAAAGTGWLNSNGQSNHLQRGQAGDYDVSVCGPLDLVWAYTGVNDHPNRNASFTDAAVAANVKATVQLLMDRQPGAIIAVPGPQWARGTGGTTYTFPQERYDATKAAVLEAAAGDPRVLYLDNSPAGENWVSAANIGSLLGPDEIHPYDGRTLARIGADSLLSKLRAL